MSTLFSMKNRAQGSGCRGQALGYRVSGIGYRQRQRLPADSGGARIFLVTRQGPLIAGHVVRHTAGQSDVSGPAVSHRHLPRLDKDGHHSFAAREFQHLGEPGSILFHIHILCLVAKGRPGLVRVGSAHLAVNNDPVCHAEVSLLSILFFFHPEPFTLDPSLRSDGFRRGC